ncbi:GNAT family N-acetyltransferase [Myroides fluvii]|uniref:GNAT family N-acetyltransferase n=1 Tax=Myroides fluvii TaxID=2572594 RepID=UPI00131CC904|nr:GNAT family N-acetyltransferase [Myroides fluvii]
MVYIETERLVLRQYKQADLTAFIRLNSDPEVMRYFLNTKTAEESEEMMLKLQGSIEANGYGAFAVEEKATQKFIGFIGFNQFVFEVDFAPAIEVLWRLLPEFWNKGYATEGAKACLDFAKEQLNLDRVYAFTTVSNKPSEQVMIKSGMTYVKNFNHPVVPSDHPFLEHKLYVKEYN